MDRLTTLRGYLVTFYVTSKLDLKPASITQLRVAVSLLDQWAGRNVTLAELSPELVTEFLRFLGDNGRSAKTVNGRRGSIVAIWRHAARKGLAPKFDPSDIPRRKEQVRRPTAWTADEMARIIWHVKRPWLRVLCLFLYETGTRLSAATALTWENWNPDLRLMQLPSETAKTGLEQFVRLTPRTAALIDQLRPANSSNSGRIFPCPNDKRSIWRELKQACKDAGLPHSRRDLFQRIRRTTATLLAAATNVETASRQLGHTSTRMTLASYIDPRLLPSIQAADVLPPL